MQGQAKKVILVGLDGADTLMVQRFVKEGRLPNIEKAMQQGVFAPDCLSMHPTITPPNWASFATGATPGTHGVTDFWEHHAQEPLDELHLGFDSGECNAEFIWDSLEKVGRRSIILNYPTGWPSTAPTNVVVDGTGVTVGRRSAIDNERMYRLSTSIEKLAESHSSVSVAQDIKYQIAAEAHQVSDRGTEDHADVPLTLVEPPSNMRSELPPFLATIPLLRGTVKRHVVVSATSPDGYDTVSLYGDEPTDTGQSLATASIGQWSGWVDDTFDLPDGSVKVNYQIKFVGADGDEPTIRLYSTFITTVESSWVYPKELHDELVSHVGPVMCHAAVTDDDIRVEVQAQMHDWYGRAAQYLTSSHDWDLLYMHGHALDYANHMYINAADPLGYKGDEHEKYLELLYRYYKLADDMVGQFLKIADQDTLLFVVSDHGAVTRTYDIPDLGDPHSVGGDLLEKWGYLHYKGEDDKRTIDWSKTRAVCQRSSYVYVNLEGRNPEGIVPPGKYDDLVTEIIERLHEYKDPETGKQPVTIALRKEDMPVLGLHGDRVGDIFFAIKPGYSRLHGGQLATGQYGHTSVKCLFTMAGPGIRKGAIVDRIVRPIDVVPTICYLTGWPVPAQAEGGVIYQGLE